MSKLKIAVIIGSTRASRFGPAPTQWIFELARKREELYVELLDLKAFDLPLYNEKATNLWCRARTRRPSPGRRKSQAVEQPPKKMLKAGSATPMRLRVDRLSPGSSSATRA
jgi:NADPH-dependent FMN reductase